MPIGMTNIAKILRPLWQFLRPYWQDADYFSNVAPAVYPVEYAICKLNPPV